MGVYVSLPPGGTQRRPLITSRTPLRHGACVGKGLLVCRMTDSASADGPRGTMPAWTVVPPSDRTAPTGGASGVTTAGGIQVSVDRLAEPRYCQMSIWPDTTKLSALPHGTSHWLTVACSRVIPHLSCWDRLALPARS